LGTWETRSGHSGRWKRRRKKFTSVQMYAILTAAIVAAGLCGRLAWQAMHATSHQGRVAFGVPAPPPESTDAIAWQRDVMASLDESEHASAAGDLSAAEVAVDRAESIVTAARLDSRKAQPEFFLASLGGLDRIWSQHPDNDLLFQHVTQARIELAALRSAQSGTPDDAQDPAASIISPEPPVLAGTGAAGSDGTATGTAKPDSKGAAAKVNRVSIAAPRNIAEDSTLDPRTLGGNYLDATLMPETAEILLLLGKRSLVDNVRVENLTIAGASQTLDGIHWSNVTFIGTRLRYEGGELELQNVHFIRCTFGFSTDDRGARLANAIALGETNFTSE